jgi:hypothetical protein
MCFKRIILGQYMFQAEVVFTAANLLSCSFSGDGGTLNYSMISVCERCFCLIL